MESKASRDDPTPVSCLSRSPEETGALACALVDAVNARARGRGMTLALLGELGVGKTVFVKAIAGALGIDPSTVSSPTFVIANQYRAPDGSRLNHVDFYRIERKAELDECGFDDLLERGALVAVEWADRFPDALPADHIRIRIARVSGASPEARRLTLEAGGRRARDVLSAFRTVHSSADADAGSKSG